MMIIDNVPESKREKLLEYAKPLGCFTKPVALQKSGEVS
jgi:hypothetical protein